MENLRWDFGYTKKRTQDGIVHQDCEQTRGSQLDLLLWAWRSFIESSKLPVPTQALLVLGDAWEAAREQQPRAAATIPAQL